MRSDGGRARENGLGPRFGDRVEPAIIGPIVGPAVAAVDAPVIRPLTPFPEELSWRPSPAESRRLTDLPDAETFIAPGIQGLYDSLAADPPAEPRSDLEPYVSYTSPDTPADPEFFNIAQIVVKFVEGSSLRLDGAKLVVTREVKSRANADRLRRAGVKLTTLRRQVAAFNSLIAPAQ